MEKIVEEFSLELFEQMIRIEIEPNGFTWGRGNVFVPDIFNAVNQSAFPNCFDNNATSKYVSFDLPPSPDVDTLAPINMYKDIADPRFRLRADEAIIIAGNTPGECKYYSFCSMLYERYFEKDLKFKEVFVSVNDPINNETIRIDSKFNSPVVIIFTPDKGTGEKIYDNMVNAGVPEEIINISVIPSAPLNLGTDFKNDVLLLMYRFYGPTDKDALDFYIKYINSNMSVYRVTPDSSSELNPYPMPTLRVRGTGKSMIDYMPTMNKLRENIIANYTEQGWKATEYKTDEWLEESLQAIQADKNMFGACSDTAYMCTEPFTMYDNEFIVIYGLNPTNKEINKATYCSAAVYGYDYFNGVNGSNSLDWENTSLDFLEDDTDSKFFVLTASRNPLLPDENQTFTVTTDIETNGVQKYKHIFVGFRNYLEEATKSGPIPKEMISPGVIKFSKPVYPSIT